MVNTNQVANYHCIGSKDNRYIAVAAYTPEVKIFEITREKNGLFKKVNKIMTLQGHRVRISWWLVAGGGGGWDERCTHHFCCCRPACWTWRSTAPRRYP